MVAPDPIVIPGSAFITVFNNDSSSVNPSSAPPMVDFTCLSSRFEGDGGALGNGVQNPALFPTVQCLYSHARVYSGAVPLVTSMLLQSTLICPLVSYPASIGGGSAGGGGVEILAGILNEVSAGLFGNARVRVSYGHFTARAQRANFTSVLDWPRTAPPAIDGISPVLSSVANVAATAMRLTFTCSSLQNAGTAFLYMSSETAWQANAWDRALSGSPTPAPYGTYIGSLSTVGASISVDITSFINSGNVLGDVHIEMWTPDTIDPGFPPDLSGDITGNFFRQVGVKLATQIDYAFDYTWTYTFPDPGVAFWPMRQKQRRFDAIFPIHQKQVTNLGNTSRLDM
jgi:hypothetical protein